MGLRAEDQSREKVRCHANSQKEQGGSDERADKGSVDPDMWKVSACARRPSRHKLESVTSPPIFGKPGQEFSGFFALGQTH